MDGRISAPRLGLFIWGYNGQKHNVHDDLISVETSKTLASDQPVGKFAITLTSKRDQEGRTWAKRIRPADYVEFYASRTAPPGAANSVVGDASGQTIILRGFVDNVYETIQVENDNVQRVVVVNGRDFGKILIKRKMVYVQAINPLAFNPALQSYFIGARLGLDPEQFVISPTEFLGRVKEVLVNDPTLGAVQGAHVPKLQAKTDIPATHTVALLNLTPQTGSIWNILQSYEGDPWNELFLRDDDDAPRLYWRRAPLHNKAGNPEWGSDQVVTISLADISSEHVLTSDNGTGGEGTYCAWLTLPTFMDQMKGFDMEAMYYTNIETGAAHDLEAALDPFNVHAGSRDFTPGNPILRTDLFLRYGFAIHNARYPLFPFPKDEETAAEFEKFADFAATLTNWLHSTESWSPIMEQGALVLQGNPAIRVGQHLRIKEQNREFYVRGVKHKFSVWPQPDFTTTVDVDRGLWLRNSPYPETAML